MNLITFNEHFDVVAVREGKTRFEKACVAPLFDYISIKSHMHECVDKLVELGEGRKDKDGDINFDFQLPFPIMRAEFQLKNSVKESLVIRYDLMVFSDVARAYFRIPNIKQVKNNVYCIELIENGGFIIEQWSEKHKEWVSLVRSASIKNMEFDNPGFQLYTQLIGSLVAFAVDAMSSSMHVAAVSPTDGEGRSVEWVKARTHFTFISHGHPANKATVKAGERIATELDKELTRMAHNRRAHYKTLRHERYRFKRGQRIKVRATWVGPKEWKDEGGKQIYRILEPSDWQPGETVR